MSSLTPLTHHNFENEIMHNVIQFSDQSLRYVPSQRELDQLIDKRIRLHAASNSIKNKQKARDFVEVQEEILQIQYSRSRTKYWFVTINPKSSVKLKTLHNAIVKMLQHPEIVECLWTYEIREAPSKGLHAHICFQTERIMDANFVQRKIKSLFVPKMCGNTKHVDVRWPESAEEFEKTKEYITKKKVSKSKRKGHTATLQWRKDQGVLDKYTEDHLLVWSSCPRVDVIPLGP